MKHNGMDWLLRLKRLLGKLGFRFVDVWLFLDLCLCIFTNHTKTTLFCCYFFAHRPVAGGAPSRHIDILLSSLANILRDECVVVKSGWFGSADTDRTLEQVQKTKSTLLLCWGHIAKGTSFNSLARHLDAQIVGPMVDILQDFEKTNGGGGSGGTDTLEIKQLRTSFLHAATCLGEAINHCSTSQSDIQLKLTTRDEWISMFCTWIHKLKNDSSTKKIRISLMSALTELVKMSPLPSNDLRTAILDVCLPTLILDSENDDENGDSIVTPLSNVLTALLTTQQHKCTNQLRMLRSLLFGGQGNDRLSNYITHVEEKVRHKSLLVLSVLLDVHSTHFPTVEHTTLCDMYALVAPRIVDRHLRIQNIATSIVQRIVSRSTTSELEKTSSSSSPSSSSALFFSTSAGAAIGAVLECPSGTRERLSALRSLCDYFAPRVPVYKDVRDYVVVLIGSLNDVDPAVAVAAAECILHLIDTRGQEFPELVELLVSAPPATDAPKDTTTNNEETKASTTTNASAAAASKPGKASTDKKKKDTASSSKKKKKQRMVQRPKCFMDSFFAMSHRERKEQEAKEGPRATKKAAVLRRQSRMLTTFGKRILQRDGFYVFMFFVSFLANHSPPIRFSSVFF